MIRILIKTDIKIVHQPMTCIMWILSQVQVICYTAVSPSQWLPQQVCALAHQQKRRELFPVFSCWVVVFWSHVLSRQSPSKIDLGNGYKEQRVCWWHLLQNQVFAFKPSRSITERMRATGDNQLFCNTFLQCPVRCANIFTKHSSAEVN